MIVITGLDPVIHDFTFLNQKDVQERRAGKTWMAGSSPAMTNYNVTR